MIEKWRKIKGFKGYEISSLGRLRSHRIGHKHTNTVPTRMLHPSINGNGYYVSQLMGSDGQPHNVQIHRLVAIAFIPNPHHFPIINHRDEDKTNNRVDNLEWCTYEYNSNYGTWIHKRAQKFKKDHFYEKRALRQNKPVLQIDPLTRKVVKKWDSCIQAEKAGFNCHHIGQCANHRVGRRTHKGFCWEWVSDPRGNRRVRC